MIPSYGKWRKLKLLSQTASEMTYKLICKRLPGQERTKVHRSTSEDIQGITDEKYWLSCASFALSVSEGSTN